ncbi:metal ABC transporter solute-binding protein, Zn/Mn family [Aestuariimicrobium soli]|uniref:metal ABC transporter solute-binding protein, Zn/Mn family n=1 Tax=Aestuariimicrobium soli TaxID=2035834 RepID=UPI003EBB075A
MRRLHTVLTAALLTVGLVALTAACSPSGESADNKAAGSSDGKPTVVASTSMWAAVARQIAGDHADVTAVIDNPQQDPHDYEASAQDKLTFSKATVTIVNGGGYDDWAVSLAAKGTTVVNAVEVSGLPGAGKDGFNEHVWYSPAAAKQVATRVSEALAKADAQHSSDYQANLVTFTTTVDELATRAQQIGAKNKAGQAGVDIVSTEPVAVHLFEAAGLTDATPHEFVEQSESDAGPSVAAVNETVKLIGSGRVRALAVNPQTSDPVADKLIAAAKQASVPTFEVYEVLPDATMSWTDFLGATLDSLEKALNQ